MRKQALDVEIACWFAWHGIRESGAIAEEPAADGGGASTSVEKKVDSCAIFYCQPCRSVKPAITLSRFDSDDGLSTYARGQGCKFDSYLGGRSALEETLRQLKLAFTNVETVQQVRGKSVKKEMWDEQDALWAAGGHMPLMAFIGEISKRSQRALVVREGKWWSEAGDPSLQRGPSTCRSWEKDHRRRQSGSAPRVGIHESGAAGATGSGATGTLERLAAERQAVVLQAVGARDLKKWHSRMRGLVKLEY